jgi:hypothetical protein
MPKNKCGNIFYVFAKSKSKSLTTMDNTPMTVIFGIPNSSKLQVGHAIGLDTSVIGHTSPIDEKTSNFD